MDTNLSGGVLREGRHKHRRRREKAKQANDDLTGDMITHPKGSERVTRIKPARGKSLETLFVSFTQTYKKISQPVFLY